MNREEIYGYLDKNIKVKIDRKMGSKHPKHDFIYPDSKDFSNEEIEALTEFQERFFEHEIIRSEVLFNSLIPELSVSNIEASKKFYENIGFKSVYARPENKVDNKIYTDSEFLLQDPDGYLLRFNN